MPRPGSRPYECVRRAWHSDRHQPMRGSLIQELFRVVNELHCSATRKNKEWQEKLPIVVLKAEEIMYSKANSEVEYMDLKTLGERANDAISTIVRLDQSTETGAFLHPCIEAALTLGCTPRRVSRSQRNEPPSCYLKGSCGDLSCPSSSLQKTTRGNQTPGTPFVFDTKILELKNANSSRSDLKPHMPFLPPVNVIWKDDSHSPSVYPLYYCSVLQSNKSKMSFDTPLNSKCHEKCVNEMDFLQHLPSCSAHGRNETMRADFRNIHEDPAVLGCDLSLRLGPSMVPLSTIEESWSQELDFSHARLSMRGCELGIQAPKTNESLSSYGNGCVDCSLISSSKEGQFGSEKGSIEATQRKRKLVVNCASNRKFSWITKLPFHNQTGRIINADISNSP